MFLPFLLHLSPSLDFNVFPWIKDSGVVTSGPGVLVYGFVDVRFDILVYSYFEKGCRKKRARDNPERYCRQLWVHCSSKQFERMARQVMGVCLRVLKESSKSRSDSYSVRNNRVLIISHIRIFARACFSENLSRNKCIISHIQSALASLFSQSSWLNVCHCQTRYQF